MNRNVYITTLADLGSDFDIYQECYQMSKESVFKFMDFDEHIVISGTYNGAFDMLRHSYRAIMDEVKRGNNVFCMEIDCIMVKPVVGMFDNTKMELFSRTSPWSIKYAGMRFDPYMNSGVKYFPASLPRDMIVKADILLRDYDESFWGYDQIIYNWMYYQQHDQATIREELNYMPFPDVLNQIKEEDAKIFHLFTTRGPKECRDKMLKLYNEFVK